MALRPAPDNSPFPELNSLADDQAYDWTCGVYFFVGGLDSVIWGVKWYNAIVTGLPFDAKFCLWEPNNDVAIATKVVSITAVGEYIVEWDDVDKEIVTGPKLAAQDSVNFSIAWTQMYDVSVYAGGRRSGRWVGRSCLDPYFDHSYNSAQDCYYSTGDTKPKTYENARRFFISPIIYGNEDEYELAGCVDSFTAPTQPLIDGAHVSNKLERLPQEFQTEEGCRTFVVPFLYGQKGKLVRLRPNNPPSGSLGI